MEPFKVVLNNVDTGSPRRFFNIPITFRDEKKYAISGLISIVDCSAQEATFTIKGSHPNISLLGELHVSHWSDEIMDDLGDKLLVNMVYGG